MSPSERAVPVPIELRYSRWLVALVGAVVLLFALSSIASEVLSRRVDDDAKRLLENALPSLSQLGAARSALRRIDRTATELAVAHADRSTLERDLTAARKQLDAALVGYLELSPLPGERARYPDVQRRLGALDVAIQQLVDGSHGATMSGDALEQQLETAADRVDGDVEALDEALSELSELARHEARLTAARIAASRKVSGRVGLALDGTCVVIAVFAAVLAAKAARRAFSLAVEEQRAKELEEFAQRVAHDLLSPLSSLTYCVGTLKRRAANDAPSQRAALRATACVSRAQQLVKSIFEFSRAGALPDPAAHSPVAEVLAGVVEDVGEGSEGEDAEEGEAPAHVEVEGFDDVEVACTPGVLSSMLANLVSNAVKFTRGSTERHVHVRVVDHGRFVRFEVEDNGPGLPADFAEHAFEAYRRAPGTTQPGLGLGLATVRRFAEAHGGAAGYRPAPRGGAVFWFELPRHEPPPAVPVERESSPDLH